MSKTEKTDPEMTHLATMAELREILKHLATKEDMQRLNVWILGSSIGIVFSLVLIGLGAYRIFVG